MLPLADCLGKGVIGGCSPRSLDNLTLGDQAAPGVFSGHMSFFQQQNRPMGETISRSNIGRNESQCSTRFQEELVLILHMRRGLGADVRPRGPHAPRGRIQRCVFPRFRQRQGGGIIVGYPGNSAQKVDGEHHAPQRLPEQAEVALHGDRPHAMRGAVARHVWEILRHAGSFLCLSVSGLVSR